MLRADLVVAGNLKHLLLLFVKIPLIFNSSCKEATVHSPYFAYYSYDFGLIPELFGRVILILSFVRAL